MIPAVRRFDIDAIAYRERPPTLGDHAQITIFISNCNVDRLFRFIANIEDGGVALGC